MLSARSQLVRLATPAAGLTVAAFAVTLFTSAALLFVVQPMIAKLLLPLLGGAPAVWATCMVFFQTGLLVGYLYVHVAIRLLGVRRQAILHAGLLLVSLAALPIGLPEGWPAPVAANPVPWLIAVLALAVGAPFVLLSASAPMLQGWFSQTTHRDAADPYFLYVPSNVGSLIALASYPLLIEPGLGLAQQTVVWSFGCAALAALVLLCAVLLWRSYQPSWHVAAGEVAGVGVLADEVGRATAEPTWPLRLRWLALSFAPSSLLLGATTYLTADVAAVPLFWIVPLALYVLTFILVFARRRLLPHSWMVRLQPFVILPLLVVMLWGVTGSVWLTFALHLAAFFVAAMVCHGELVRHRPAPRALTEFYLWMSIGGVCGGVFNAIIAPLAFDRVIEYPVALILVCLLRPGRDAGRGWRAQVLDVALPVAFGAALVWAIVPNDLAEDVVGWMVLTAWVVLFGLAWVERPVRYGVWVGALLVATSLYAQRAGTTLLLERSFFGVSRVADAASGMRQYWHGSTLHGAQLLDPDRRLEPTTYYTRSSPFADLVEALLPAGPARRVAVLELGAGATACYGKGGDSRYYLEIDPLVVDIAYNYFTYLSECPPTVEVILGDARLGMMQMDDSSFDLVVADAFSSDAIPVHLITREAVELYFQKIKPGGILAVHITNRHVNLEPVLADLSRALGLASLLRDDRNISGADSQRHDKEPTRWVVIARSEQELASLHDEPGWRALWPRGGVRHWTDDYSNIVTVLE